MIRFKKLKPLYAFLIFILIWWIISIVIKNRLVPSPFMVIPNTILIFKSKLLIHSLYSLKRILFGLLFGTAIGFPIGLFLGYFKKFDKWVSPLIYLIYPIPKISFLPIIMLLMGLGDKAKITIIVIIIIFQIIVSIRDHVCNLEDEIYYPLITLGANKTDVFLNILIPSSIPKLLSATRIALGTSISVLFFSETFGTVYGLGYFIMDSMLRINYLEMYSGILSLSLMGLLLFLIIDILEKKIINW